MGAFSSTTADYLDVRIMEQGLGTVLCIETYTSKVDESDFTKTRNVTQHSNRDTCGENFVHTPN
jgi:hypothetical protein